MSTTVVVGGKSLTLKFDTEIPQTDIDCKQVSLIKMQDNYRLYSNEGEPWPVLTDIPCMSDCHPFTSTPIPLVYDYDDQRKIFYVYNNYCSVNCAKYAAIHTDHSPIRLNYFNLMIRNVFKIYDPVFPSPPPMLLEYFGGSMSLDEYRTKSTTCHLETVSPYMIKSTMCRSRQGVSTNSSCTILPQNKLYDRSDTLFNQFVMNHKEEEEEEEGNASMEEYDEKEQKASELEEEEEREKKRKKKMNEAEKMKRKEEAKKKREEIAEKKKAEAAERKRERMIKKAAGEKKRKIPVVSKFTSTGLDSFIVSALK